MPEKNVFSWLSQGPSRIDRLQILSCPVGPIAIKRDDLIHCVVSGNKWRKLKYNLKKFNSEGLISFGGAFSNHLHALAYACHKQSIPLKAIVRGKSSYLDNPTLKAIKEWGADVIFVDRPTYRKRYDARYLQGLESQYPGFQIIPEGGSNESALEGVQELGKEIMEQFPSLKNLVLPVGSGGTMAGLIRSLPQEVQIIGISVGKEDYLEKMIGQWLKRERNSNWVLERRFHYGGFGRCPQALRKFMHDMHCAHSLPLDVVYNAKGFYAFLELLLEEKIKPDESLYLHTGGLQGNRAYQYLYPGTLKWIND
ncbi:MAG TPA: pyridoxal-phosphate dependent enzyme [Saprospiraceae bacterium]|nr:pyridoxal-phosphate dependent enzyme [Saprospiraceae bacterium]